MEHLRELNRLEGMNIFELRNLMDDLFFKELQDDPEFQRIRSELISKYYAQHETVRKWMEENHISVRKLAEKSERKVARVEPIQSGQ